MSQKPMSASAYRANAEKAKAQRSTEIVTLKSGAVFELRRPDLQAWLLTGRLPQSLLNEGLKAWKKTGIVTTEQAAKDLGGEEMIEALVFMQTIVEDCTVSPKYVQFPSGDNEIGPQTLLEEDFMEIFNWAMSGQGVTGLGGLKSFRNRQERRAAGSKSRGKKLQPEAVSNAAN